MLLGVLHGLPGTSLLAEAMATDPELAREAALADVEVSHAPRFRDWSPERDSLAAIYDRLGTVVQAVIAASGGKNAKPPTMPPHPRPRGSAESARQARRKERHYELVNRFKKPQPER